MFVALEISKVLLLIDVSFIHAAFVHLSNLFPKMTVLVHQKRDIFLGSGDDPLYLT